MTTATETPAVLIELTDLVPRPGNRRSGGISQEGLQELADSIARKGVLQPLIVRRVPSPTGDAVPTMEIVAGERRSAAAGLAGLKKVPCRVMDLTDEEADEVALVDNLHRVELHPMDEAELYQSICARLVQGGADDALRETAARAGKPLRYVAQRLQLVHLVPEARDLWRKEERFTLGHAILVARLPIDSQRDLLKELKRQDWAMDHLDEFKEFVERKVYRQLAKVPWRLDDSRLLPAAGACWTCQKRTGANATLFPEIAKGDVCLDGACFAKKLDAVIAQRKGELAAEPYLVVSAEHGTAGPGVLTFYQWAPAKKGEKGAVRAIVVAGKDQGKIIYARKTESVDTGRRVVSEAEKAAKKKADAAAKLSREVGRALWGAVMKRADEMVGSDGFVPQAVLVMLAAYAFERQYERAALAKLEGWELSPTGFHPARKLFAKFTPDQLIVAMLKSMLASELNPSLGGNREDLREVAKAYGVDAAAIEKQVRDQAVADAEYAKQVAAGNARMAKDKARAAKKPAGKAKGATA